MDAAGGGGAHPGQGQAVKKGQKDAKEGRRREERQQQLQAGEGRGGWAARNGSSWRTRKSKHICKSRPELKSSKSTASGG